MSRIIEVWINTNEKANSEPLEHYWDVEVKLNPENNVVFQCNNKEAANKLKQWEAQYKMSL